jgi:protein SCO1/2
MILLVSIMLLVPAPSDAAQRLHGVVLAVTPATGEVVVRRESSDSTSGATMPFRILPRERAAELRAGSVIDADVDRTTHPWTLRHVSSTSTEALVTAAQGPQVALLRAGESLPADTFVDQDGRPFRFAQLHGAEVVVTFIATRAQDPSGDPALSARFRALQDALGARPVHLVEVTVDPAYDRPPVLRRYAATFGADPRRWMLVTGDAAPLLDLAARAGVTITADRNQGLIHDERTLLVGPDGRLRAIVAGASWTPRGLLAQLEGDPRSALQRFGVVAWLAAAALALLYLARRTAELRGFRFRGEMRN